MTPPEQSDSRRVELMRLLAEEGAGRCCYLPGAGHPEAWTTATCDCKYRPVGGAPPSGGSTEQTGCCEMRAAYNLLASESRRS